MTVRRLGDSDTHLSPVCLDTRNLTDDPDGDAVIRTALDLGVNLIQTDPGRGEYIVGEVVATGQAPRPYVFTRSLLLTSTKDGPEERVPTTAADVRGACVDSLRRLKASAIDLYEVSVPSPEHAIEVWQEVAALHREQKVRWIAVPDLEQLRAAREIVPVHALQMRIRLLYDPAQHTELAYCQENGVGVLAHLPEVGSVPRDGSRYEMGTQLKLALSLGVCRHWSEFVADRPAQAPRVVRALAIADEFRRIGAAHGHGPDAAAVAWALRTIPAVTAVVVAPRNPAQVEDALAGVDLSLSDEEIARIEALRGRD